MEDAVKYYVLVYRLPDKKGWRKHLVSSDLNKLLEEADILQDKGCETEIMGGGNAVYG